MVQINFGQREVSCKVVFYGPGMSGKTTNLEIIHKKAPKDAVGEMVSIATETDRTLYFDFLPLDLGQVAGMRTKFQLYTVPGQIYYNATRKLVLQGVDGVIFVADSAPDKMAENIESLNNLRDNLAEMGLKLEDVPTILQYNKRDLPNALSVDEMNKQMNPMGFPTFEACARDGKGVFATLKECSRLVIERLNKDHGPNRARRPTQGGLTPSTGQPSVVPQGATPVPPQPAVHAAPPAPALAPAPAPTPPRPLPAATAPPPPAPPPRPVGNTPAFGQPQLRPPAPPPRPPAPPPRPPGYNPHAPTPTMGSPAAQTDDAGSAREKHLAKAKPPALGERRGAPVPDLGQTDPNLKKYQEKSGDGGMVKTLVIVLLFVVIAVILLGVMTLFVPAVRSLLPLGLQQQIEKMVGGTPAAPEASRAP